MEERLIYNKETKKAETALIPRRTPQMAAFVKAMRGVDEVTEGSRMAFIRAARALNKLHTTEQMSPAVLQKHSKSLQLGSKALVQYATSQDFLNKLAASQRIEFKNARDQVLGYSEMMNKAAVSTRRLATRSSKNLLLLKEQRRAVEANNRTLGFFGNKITPESMRSMNQLGAAAQGVVMAMSAMDGNVLGLAFSLIFLKFTMGGVALATAGITAGLVMIYKASTRTLERTKQWEALQNRMKNLGSATTITKQSYDELEGIAKKLGLSTEDLSTILYNLAQNRIEPTAEVMGALMKTANITGRSFQDMLKIFLNLVRPTELVISDFDQWQKTLVDLLGPARALDKNTAFLSDNFLDLFSAMASTTDVGQRAQKMAEALIKTFASDKVTEGITNWDKIFGMFKKVYEWLPGSLIEEKFFNKTPEDAWVLTIQDYIDGDITALQNLTEAATTAQDTVMQVIETEYGTITIPISVEGMSEEDISKLTTAIENYFKDPSNTEVIRNVFIASLLDKQTFATTWDTLITDMKDDLAGTGETAGGYLLEGLNTKLQDAEPWKIDVDVSKLEDALRDWDETVVLWALNADESDIAAAYRRWAGKQLEWRVRINYESGETLQERREREEQQGKLSWVEKYLGIKLPGLAEGAIVTQPTLGIFGEAGPEAIIPLKNMQSVVGGTNIVIDARGATFLHDRLPERLLDQISERLGSRMGRRRQIILS
jgi:hypothetical protein